MNEFYVSAICENGDILSQYLEENEPYNKFCKICGASVINRCPFCKAFIQGAYRDVFIKHNPKAPNFCHDCGQPYPWTAQAIKTIKDLIQEDDLLTQLEKDNLKSSVPDLLSETPRTQLASIRIKKAFLIVGKFTAEGIRKFIIDCGCEFVKSYFNF